MKWQICVCNWTLNSTAGSLSCWCSNDHRSFWVLSVFVNIWKRVHCSKWTQTRKKHLKHHLNKSGLPLPLPGKVLTTAYWSSSNWNQWNHMKLLHLMPHLSTSWSLTLGSVVVRQNINEIICHSLFPLPSFPHLNLCDRFAVLASLSLNPAPSFSSIHGWSKFDGCAAWQREQPGDCWYWAFKRLGCSMDAVLNTNLELWHLLAVIWLVIYLSSLTMITLHPCVACRSMGLHFLLFIVHPLSPPPPHTHRGAV